MRTFRTMLLAVSLLILTSQALAQNPGASLADANNQAVLQSMQQSSWYGQDPYHRGYAYSGPDYTCPQQPTIVNAPPGAAGPQGSAPPPSNPANVTTAPDGNLASPAPVYVNQDTVPTPAPANQDVVPTPTQSAGSAAAKAYAILTCGTFVRLEFASPVSSKTAQVGDRIALRVAEDIRVGSTTIVPKGTLAEGTITFVRHTAPGGMPGSLGYELNALRVNGTSVPLWRIEGRTGDPKTPGPEVLIPVAGAFTVFRHGKDAEIKPGSPVTALVAADTTLPLQP